MKCGYNKCMRKVVFVVVAIAIPFILMERQTLAYTITPADTVVSACVGDGPCIPTTPSPTPSVSTTPTPTPTGGAGARFSLFGYTSPGALVSVTNPGMYVDTTADKSGYFEFHNFFSRLLIEDICLTAQDQEGRVTMPVCIPPVPAGDNLSIGPVVMPPTISLNGDSFYAGDSVVVTGETTPNANIKLSLFTDESKSSLGQSEDKGSTLALRFMDTLTSKFTVIHTVYAATKPKKDIQADGHGHYTLALTSNQAEYYRTFAQTRFNNDYSLKSNTLNFDIFPGWFLIMKLLLGFLAGLKSRIWEIIVLSQLAIIAFLILRHYLRPHTIARMRALAILEHPLPILTEHQLLIEKHELTLRRLVDQKEALRDLLRR